MSQCKQEPCTYLLASDDAELSKVVFQRQSFSFLGGFSFLSFVLHSMVYQTRAAEVHLPGQIRTEHH